MIHVLFCARRCAWVLCWVALLALPVLSGAQTRPDIRWMKGLGANLAYIAYSADKATMLRVTTGEAQLLPLVQIYQVSTGRVLRTFNIDCLMEGVGASSDLSLLCVQVDKPRPAGGTDPTLRLYRVSDAQILWEQYNSIQCPHIEFARGGNLICGWSPGASSFITIRNVSDGTVAFGLADTGAYHYWYQLSPDGTEIAGAGNYNIDFWRLSNGSHLRGWADSAEGLGPYSPNGKGLLRGARYLSTSNGALLATLPLRSFTNNSGAYTGFYWKGDDTLLGAAVLYGTSAHSPVTYLDSFDLSAATRSELTEFTSPSAVPGPSAMSPDYDTLALSGGTTPDTISILQYFDTTSGALTGAEEGHGTVVNSVTFSPDGRQAASSGNDGIRLWDRLTGSLQKFIPTPHMVYRAAYSPAGTRLVVSYGGFGYNAGLSPADIWNTDGTLATHLTTPNGYGPRDACFSSDGKYVLSGDYDATVRIWRASDGALLFASGLPGGLNPAAVACSPTNAGLGAVAANGTVFQIAIPSGSLIRSTNLGWGAAALAFTADGKKLAAVGGGGRALINVSDGSVVWSTTEGYVNYRLGLEPCGRYLVSAYNPFNPADGSPLNGLVRIFRMTDGAEVRSYTDETGAANQYASLGAAWSPDGEAIAYTRFDGIVVMAKNPFYALPKLSSVSASPASVAGGGKCTGTVTLDCPAPVVVNDAYVDGATVSLTSSNTALAQVPDSVTIPGPLTKATFPITTFGVTSTQTVTITAKYNNGLPKSKTITLNPPALSSVSVTPTSVVAGAGATGTVTLNGTPAAGTGGIKVTLGSNNAAASVPSSVLVQEGQTSATFPITTSGVTANTSVLFLATYGSLGRTATLTVKPAALSSMTLSPTTVKGGVGTSTATVTLTGVAPASGYTVNLTSGNAAAQVPASVTVPEGQSSAQFTVTTSTVTAKITITLTATPPSGSAKTAKLTVTP